MTRAKQFFFLIISYLSVQTLFSQNLKFYREDLTFEIKNGYFYVDGFYNFCNKEDKALQQILFYPFPLDEMYGAVDSVSAVDINKKSLNVITDIAQSGAFFKVELPPYGIGKYKIAYRQKLLKNKAEYILLTTQKWGVPFESAFYKLVIPETLNMVSVSYQPDSLKHTGDKQIYYWTKKDFMPDRNMIFYFKLGQ